MPNILFVDETKRMKDREEKAKLLSKVVKPDKKKKRLRKQLQNNNLLENYFEWNKEPFEKQQQTQTKQHAGHLVFQFKVNYVDNDLKYITKEEVTTTTTEPGISSNENDQEATFLEEMNETVTVNNRINNNSQANKENSHSCILVSEELSLKLDLDDFLKTLEQQYYNKNF
ncbi:hypothetical protein ABK040_016271 [Willaertia magna]